MGTVASDPSTRSGTVHSHDRTLVASLGFADPDKRDRRHDLACQYLAIEENRRKVADVLGFELPAVDRFHEPFRHEYPITKGEGQYLTTVGFLDLVVRLSRKEPCRGPHCCNPPQPDGMHRLPLSVGIEVKIHPVGVGDLLRQLNLYRTFVRCDAWIVASPFSFTAPELDALRSASIHHVRLGENFDRWCQEQAEAPPAAAGSSLVL
jgi:hypothetical protein